MNNTTVTDYTKNGKCSGCGACCSNLLPLSNQEVKRIKAYIKQHNIKEQRHNGIVGIDMTCPFRDEKNRKCLIYEIRPAICRSFVCNHTQEEIEKAKLDFHKINQIVCMRAEFFDNKEDAEWLGAVMRMVAENG